MKNSREGEKNGGRRSKPRKIGPGNILESVLTSRLTNSREGEGDRNIGFDNFSESSLSLRMGEIQGGESYRGKETETEKIHSKKVGARKNLRESGKNRGYNFYRYMSHDFL